MKRFFTALAAALIFAIPAACLVPPVRGWDDAPLPQNDLSEEEPALPPEPETELAAEPASEPPMDLETEHEAEPSFETEPNTEQGVAATYVRTLANGLNVRVGAGTQYASLGTVQSGVLLHLEGRCGDWYETRFRGQRAYVSADERYSVPLSMAGSDARIERVIAAGLDVLGTPYVYGATRMHDGTGAPIAGFSKDAFDCSSLMQYMFACEGVMLGVTTRVQVKQGHHVQQEEICRGDLLFFTNAARKNRTGLERVGHVAMYLGENYILHTASDYAKIELVSATRWDYFLEARRFL